jgi:hypothetical protein
MSNPLTAAGNIGRKALRRLGSAHKPFVRLARQRARAKEQASFAREAREIEEEIAAVAAGSGPIVAGPWLAEVGYEALYWVPFLRWFQDTYRIAPDRITVVSRGGVREWYRGIAGTYLDIFDRMTPADLAARNDARMALEEGGGRKQSTLGAVDKEILEHVLDTGARGKVLHPSLMFRLFRHVWHGNLPFDFFWTHTDYTLMRPPRVPDAIALPPGYAVAKFYTGVALPPTSPNRALLRDLVARTAARMPVIVLETGLAVDDHQDYLFADLANVTSAREWMRPADNLGVQTAIIGGSQLFLGTCGGLAWLAPFLGVPTVAVYADDRQLAPHLFVARQAGRRVGAADFLPLDLRAVERLAIPSHCP